MEDFDVKDIMEIDIDGVASECECSEGEVAMVYEVSSGFRDAVYNDLASKYIADNYKELVMSTRNFGIGENFRDDLINDLFISIVSKEEAGEGYDEGLGISVREFIFGCIKGYAKNLRYKNSSDIRYKKSKDSEEREKIGAFASSFTGSEESLSGFQMALVNAVDENSGLEYEDSERYIDLVNDVSMCLEFEDRVNMDLKVFFKNIEMFVEMVQGRNRTIFNKLFDTLKLHGDFESSFLRVVEMYGKNKEAYMKVMDTI